MDRHRHKPSDLSNLVYQIARKKRKDRETSQHCCGLQPILRADLVTQGSPVYEPGLKSCVAVSGSRYMTESECMLFCGWSLRSRPQRLLIDKCTETRHYM